MTAKSKYFDSLATMVASGESVASAAATVGAGNSTAYRIAKSPEFKTAVSEIRTDLLTASLGKLSTASSLAVTTMVELLGCDDDGVRLRAATAILDRFSKHSESVDLRERIEALEKAQAAR